MMVFERSVSISFSSKPFRASIEPRDRQLSKPMGIVSKVLVSGLFGLMCVFFAFPAFPADVTLAWDPNSEPDLEGYGVYYSKGAPGPPFDLFGYVTQEEFSDPANPTFTVTGLEKGAKYYFALTAFDSAGAESLFSDPVCAEVGDIIAPCSTETSIDSGGSSGGGSSAGGSSSGGSNSNGGGGCFIDAASADTARFNPQTAALTALGCIVAGIRITQRRFKRLWLLARSEADESRL
jgi:uncharacterized membrane protein YgcG